MIVLELDYMLIYHRDGKEESHTTTVERGRIPYVADGFAIEYITKKQYEDYNRLRRIVGYI